MNSIFDLITSQAVASYYETLATNRIPLLGEVLFPQDKKTGLKLEWIKGYDSLPVALMPSAFDAKPTLRDRRGIGTESTKMPFFREAMRLGEEDRQQLLMFASANAGNAYAREIITRIYDDTIQLIEGALIVPEIMRMGIIANGTFSISSPDDSGSLVSYDYNYDPQGDWAAKNTTTLSTTTDKWSDYANSNPVADILEVKRDAGRRGIALTRAIIGYETWVDILSNQKIKAAMFPLATSAANVMAPETAVKAFVEQQTGIKIQVYDKQYKTSAGTDAFFYPTKGQMTLLPSNALGKTWFGTTPEEADLMAGNTLAQVSLVHNNGIAVSTEKQALPVNIINWVSEIVLPSFENMNQVFNIKY